MSSQLLNSIKDTLGYEAIRIVLSEDPLVSGKIRVAELEELYWSPKSKSIDVVWNIDYYNQDHTKFESDRIKPYKKNTKVTMSVKVNTQGNVVPESTEGYEELPTEYEYYIGAIKQLGLWATLEGAGVIADQNGRFNS